ncbi:MAG TPA: hypothetical protein VMU62_00400, partial [Acidobacteriaceae bacterium]|nr:hypothetical protein [Acidobacteriaceae bacterium]
MRLANVAVLLLVLVPFGVLGEVSSTTSWQGSFVVGGERHRMVLQAEQGADGKWTVRSFAVDFLPEPIHVDTAKFADGHVMLSANGGKGAYVATLNADSSTLDGTWTWMQQPVAVELRRVPNEAAWHTPMNVQYHFKDITYARP